MCYVSIRYNFKGTHQIQMNKQRLKPTNEMEKEKKRHIFDRRSVLVRRKELVLMSILYNTTNNSETYMYAVWLW